MNFSNDSNYVDAVELCRLGCKAIVLEKFDAARRYFELAADQGSLEAAVSLEVLFNQGFVEPFVLEEFAPLVAYEPVQFPAPGHYPLISYASENYLQDGHAMPGNYMIDVPDSLQIRPEIRTTVYSH